MSWIAKNTLNIFQELGVNILKCGPVPKHVAVIMDGNRRYAKKHEHQKIVGHYKGFSRMSEAIQWCIKLGITEITVYAFSIDNFKRSCDEVEALCDLAREKLKQLLQESDIFMRNGVRFRVIGNRSLIPDDINVLIGKAELLTKDNCRFTFNMAFAYTENNVTICEEFLGLVSLGQDEIVHAVNTVIDGVKEGLLNEEDVSVELLKQCLYTRSSPEPDLLIRTSGESRLSNFLLLQSCFSCLYFTDVLWPEFGAWDFLKALLHYQRAYAKLQLAKEQHSSVCRQGVIGSLKFNTVGITKNAAIFLGILNDRYWESIHKMIAE